MRIAALAVAALLSAPAVAAAQGEKKTDLTGTWTFSVTTDAGTGTPTVTLKQAVDTLTGHYSSQALGEADLKGTIKDNKLSFVFDANVQGTTFKVTYTGTVEADGTLKGTVDLGGYGGGTFTAKRQAGKAELRLSGVEYAPHTP